MTFSFSHPLIHFRFLFITDDLYHVGRWLGWLVGPMIHDILGQQKLSATYARHADGRENDLSHKQQETASSQVVSSAPPSSSAGDATNDGKQMKQQNSVSLASSGSTVVRRSSNESSASSSGKSGYEDSGVFLDISRSPPNQLLLNHHHHHDVSSSSSSSSSTTGINFSLDSPSPEFNHNNSNHQQIHHDNNQGSILQNSKSIKNHQVGRQAHPSASNNQSSSSSCSQIGTNVTTQDAKIVNSPSDTSFMQINQMKEIMMSHNNQTSTPHSGFRTKRSSKSRERENERDLLINYHKKSWSSSSDTDPGVTSSMSSDSMDELDVCLSSSSILSNMSNLIEMTGGGNHLNLGHKSRKALYLNSDSSNNSSCSSSEINQNLSSPDSCTSREIVSHIHKTTNMKSGPGTDSNYSVNHDVKSGMQQLFAGPDSRKSDLLEQDAEESSNNVSTHDSSDDGNDEQEELIVMTQAPSVRERIAFFQQKSQESGGLIDSTSSSGSLLHLNHPLSYYQPLRGAVSCRHIPLEVKKQSSEFRKTTHSTSFGPVFLNSPSSSTTSSSRDSTISSSHSKSMLDIYSSLHRENNNHNCNEAAIGTSGGGVNHSSLFASSAAVSATTGLKVDCGILSQVELFESIKTESSTSSTPVRQRNSSSDRPSLITGNRLSTTINHLRSSSLSASSPSVHADSLLQMAPILSSQAIGGSNASVSNGYSGHLQPSYKRFTSYDPLVSGSTGGGVGIGPLKSSAKNTTASSSLAISSLLETRKQTASKLKGLIIPDVASPSSTGGFMSYSSAITASSFQSSSSSLSSSQSLLNKSLPTIVSSTSSGLQQMQTGKRPVEANQETSSSPSSGVGLIRRDSTSSNSSAGSIKTFSQQHHHHQSSKLTPITYASVSSSLLEPPFATLKNTIPKYSPAFKRRELELSRTSSSSVTSKTTSTTTTSSPFLLTHSKPVVAPKPETSSSASSFTPTTGSTPSKEANNGTIPSSSYGNNENAIMLSSSAVVGSGNQVNSTSPIKSASALSSCSPSGSSTPPVPYRRGQQQNPVNNDNVNSSASSGGSQSTIIRQSSSESNNKINFGLTKSSSSSYQPRSCNIKDDPNDSDDEASIKTSSSDASSATTISSSSANSSANNFPVNPVTSSVSNLTSGESTSPLAPSLKEKDPLPTPSSTLAKSSSYGNNFHVRFPSTSSDDASPRSTYTRSRLSPSVSSSSLLSAAAQELLGQSLSSSSSALNSSYNDNKKYKTIKAVLNKEGAGLGFILEGGKDSPLGDRPLAIKKIFKGESTFALMIIII